ncbi:HIRAN domain-containing protein [Bacillales bacterium AN1005]
MSYSIVDVSTWETVSEEHPGYIGEREKEWLKEPLTGKLAMFKIPREDRGEHWAEKLCSELAASLSFPCAKVELAIRDGVYGSLSYFFVEKEKGYSHFDSGSFFNYTYNDEGRIEYNIEVIEEFLEKSNLFADFLYIVLFDALIANGDRHQDNWGITRHEKEDTVAISPMYDNSASLGRDLSSGNIEKFISSDSELLRHLFKGKAKIGMKDKRGANHFALIRFLKSKYPEKFKGLFTSLSNLEDHLVEEIVDMVPEEILDVEYKRVVTKFIQFRRDILLNIGDDMDKNINELLLVWKEPESRQRYVVGKLIYNGDENKYLFSYLSENLQKAVSVGFKNYPSFPDLGETYESKGQLFPGLMNRLPNKKRPNYPEILLKYNLDTTSTVMEILGATRGRLGTDNFEFVQFIEFIQNQPFQITFDLAAARRYDFPSVKGEIKENEVVTLIRDMDNQVDVNAVRVIYRDNLCLGYVPRYYSEDLAAMLEAGVQYKAIIKKLDILNDNPDEWAKIRVEVIYE